MPRIDRGPSSEGNLTSRSRKHLSVVDPVDAAELEGSRRAGPTLAGPTLAGPTLAGPTLAGPTLAGPLLSTLEREILPRLVVAHQSPEKDRAQARPPESLTPAPSDITALTRLASEGSLTDALALVERLFQDGLSVERLLLEVIAPAARALGDAWLEDTCSFIEVTAGLGTLQQLVLTFRPAEASARHGGRVLLLPAPGEQHTLGLFMLAELVRRCGMDVRLETAASIEAVAALVVEERWVAVGISVGSERFLASTASLIRAIRRQGAGPPILLGGALDARDFAQDHDVALWTQDPREMVRWLHARAMSHLTDSFAVK